jgi:hypothetical protein
MLFSSVSKPIGKMQTQDFLDRDGFDTCMICHEIELLSNSISKITCGASV